MCKQLRFPCALGLIWVKGACIDLRMISAPAPIKKGSATMLRKSLIAAAVALCSNGTGAAELKVTELGVVETLVDAYTVQKHCGVKPDFSAFNSRLQEQGVDPKLAPAVAAAWAAWEQHGISAETPPPGIPNDGLSLEVSNRMAEVLSVSSKYTGGTSGPDCQELISSVSRFFPELGKK